MTVVRKRMMKNVKYYRKLRNLSQQDLADKCSLSVNFICEIENGRKFPSPETMEKLIEFFKISPEDLFREQQKIVPFYGSEIDTEHMSKVMISYINQSVIKYVNSWVKPQDSPN